MWQKIESLIIASFAMAAVNSEGIRNAFGKTGIYPLNRVAILSNLLASDEVCHRSENTDNTQRTSINDNLVTASV